MYVLSLVVQSVRNSEGRIRGERIGGRIVGGGDSEGSVNGK